MSEKEATGRPSRARQTENTAPAATGSGEEAASGGKSKVSQKKVFLKKNKEKKKIINK